MATKTPLLKQRLSYLVKRGLFTTFLGTTAYDLCTQIKKIITADARTMRMRAIRTLASELPEEQRPMCGTVCCIKGWMDHLTAASPYQSDAYTAQLLGFTGLELEKAIIPGGGVLETLFYGDLLGDRFQGTKEHADKVVKAITEFQREHKAQLQATIVTPVVAAAA